MRAPVPQELSLKGPEGLRSKTVFLYTCVCVGAMCETSADRFVCVSAQLVCVCVPCGSRGQTEHIRVTDVPVTLNAGVQTRHIHLL